MGHYRELLMDELESNGDSNVAKVEALDANYALYVITSGATVGGTITLYGSPDGTNWVSLGTTSPTSAAVAVITSTKPAIKLKATLSVRSNGKFSCHLVVPHKGH